MDHQHYGGDEEDRWQQIMEEMSNRSREEARSRSPARKNLHRRPDIDLHNLTYVTNVVEHLLCPICHEPLVDPQTTICDHTFCGECLEKAIEYRSDDRTLCPTCRRPLHRGDVRPASKMIRQILDDLDVRCPNEQRGCEQALARSTVPFHVERYCDYTEIDCADKSCDGRMNRLNANLPCQHKDNGHERALQPGQQSGPAALANSDDEAMEESAPSTAKTCSAAEYGCDFTGTGDETALHENTCALRRLVPFLAKQQAVLESHTNALEQLTRKNNLYEKSFAEISTKLESLEIQASSSAQRGYESQSEGIWDAFTSLKEGMNTLKYDLTALDGRLNMELQNSSARDEHERLQTQGAIFRLSQDVELLLHERRDSLRIPGAGFPMMCSPSPFLPPPHSARQPTDPVAEASMAFMSPDAPLPVGQMEDRTRRWIDQSSALTDSIGSSQEDLTSQVQAVPPERAFEPRQHSAPRRRLSDELGAVTKL